MTQVEDKNARPGTPVVSHNTGRWKRGRTTVVYSPVCRKRKRWLHWWRWLKRLWGSLPGVPEWRYTTMRCTQIKIKLHTFPARGGGGLLGGGVIVVSATMATQNSVSFSLPLLWAHVSKHTLVESVQPPELMAPLQLVDGSLRSEQIADNNAFTHMMKNTQK